MSEHLGFWFLDSSLLFFVWFRAEDSAGYSASPAFGRMSVHRIALLQNGERRRVIDREVGDGTAAARAGRTRIEAIGDEVATFFGHRSRRGSRLGDP